MATLSARPRRMSVHSSPGEGGTMRRRMVPRPERPFHSRAGDKPNHHSAPASHAANRAAPAILAARRPGVAPKAAGIRSRQEATSFAAEADISARRPWRR